MNIWNERCTIYTSGSIPYIPWIIFIFLWTLQRRHNELAGVSNHQHQGCVLNRLFKRRSEKTSKLRITGICAGNSPVTGEIPAQRASNAKNVSIWWRHHGFRCGHDISEVILNWYWDKWVSPKHNKIRHSLHNVWDFLYAMFLLFNTLRPRQNHHCLCADIFWCIFVMKY